MSGRLPVELTSFVGRRREVAEVRRLLSTARLVTLAGCGGVGKTRLAQRVGAELQRTVRDGVWSVGLGDLRDAELSRTELHDPHTVAYLIGVELGLKEARSRSHLDQLTRHLSSRELLLVLDNCEHVPAMPAVVAHLLRGSLDLRVLATSRERLMVDGEVLFEVPPLGLPPDQRDATRSESVDLFVSRATEAAPDFEITSDNAAAIGGICRRLDGLPLAIELAAVRVRALAPQQILERLNDPFALLSRGPRVGPDRQQTLRACLDWSFELCSAPERTLWTRLAVFTGSFDLDTATGVCADDVLAVEDVLEVFASLVDKSVLTRVTDDSAPRYRLLQPIREYGYARLRECGGELRWRHRHKDWYRRLLARAGTEWIGPRQAHWLRRLDADEPNLAATFDFCLAQPGEAEAALDMALSMPSHWWMQGRLTVGARWVEQALTRTTAPTSLRARGLLLRAALAFWHGDLVTGEGPLAEGRALAERLGDDVALSNTGHLEGIGAMYRGDLAVGFERLVRALELLGPAGDAELDLRLNVLTGLAVAAEMLGDAVTATACQREILDITTSRGECVYRSRAMWRDSMAAWQAGDSDRAAALASDAIRLRRAHGLEDLYATALCLEMLAWAAARSGRHRRAASLLGAADALWSDLDFRLASRKHLADPQTECYRVARAALGDVAFDEAWQRGRSLSRTDAIAYALEEDSSPARRPPSTPDHAPLTRREAEVAHLVADGLSNQEIAKRLVISRRTAENHVARILHRLGFSSRAQIAAWIVEQRRPLPNVDSEPGTR